MVVAFVEDILDDFKLIFMAIILVAVYTVLMLGNFSPLHCRCVLATVGLFCVMLAYTSGFGLMFLFGGQTTGVHQLMPFLLIGIGVDDMFVICNAVDQTNLKASSFERLTEAMGHAGPAITITSLTNALAFAFGATTSLMALKSFCLFASVCIIMLYFACLTIFLAALAWDTRRVGNKKRECCGACCCQETSAICCKGKCLSPKQREFSGVPYQVADDLDKYDEATKTVLEASATERCLGKCFAPCVLSTIGRIVFLILYVLLIVGAVLGALKVEVEFDVSYFISDRSSIYEWYQAQDTYFTKSAISESTIIYI